MQANDGGSRVRGAWMGVAVVLVWASGCTPSAAGPDPAPSPVVRTPSAAPSTPSREEQYEAEAIEAYWNARSAWEEVVRAGGSAETPDSYLETMSGQYLAAQADIAKRMHDAGHRAGGESRRPRVYVSAVTLPESVADGPPTVDLIACEDGSGRTRVNSAGEPVARDVPQKLFVQEIVAKPDPTGVWKLDQLDTQPVDSFEGQGVCDAG